MADCFLSSYLCLCYFFSAMNTCLPHFVIDSHRSFEDRLGITPFWKPSVGLLICFRCPAISCAYQLSPYDAVLWSSTSKLDCEILGAGTSSYSSWWLQCHSCPTYTGLDACLLNQWMKWLQTWHVVKSLGKGNSFPLNGKYRHTFWINEIEQSMLLWHLQNEGWQRGLGKALKRIKSFQEPKARGSSLSAHTTEFGLGKRAGSDRMWTFAQMAHFAAQQSPSSFWGFILDGICHHSFLASGNTGGTTVSTVGNQT